MKLQILRDVIFDEFPTDKVIKFQVILSHSAQTIIAFYFKSIFILQLIFFQSVKYCFFTQPKYPTKDYSQYSDGVTYCGTEATLLVLSSFAVRIWSIFFSI